MKSASRRVQHSKFKNTGILFELLVRQVTVDTLSDSEKSSALQLIRKYFRPETTMGKELILYRSLMDTDKLPEARANKLLEMIVKHRKKLSNRKLSEQKYELIKEVKELYPLKEFLSSKIPNYKVYASIYKTFATEGSSSDVDICDINDVAAARFTILEHLTQTSTEESKDKVTLIESFKSQQEDLRLLTYKVLVDKFNEKYKNLSVEQKNLLREYINNVSNTNSLREHVNSEVPRIKQELQARLRSIDDKVVRIKLKEVISQLDNIKKGRIVRDNQVSALMVAYELVKEIDNVTEAR
jgi:hypothetical protein